MCPEQTLGCQGYKHTRKVLGVGSATLLEALEQVLTKITQARRVCVP